MTKKTLCIMRKFKNYKTLKVLSNTLLLAVYDSDFTIHSIIYQNAITSEHRGHRKYCLLKKPFLQILIYLLHVFKLALLL